MRLESDEVHLYLVFSAQVSNPELTGRYHALMNADEVRRYERFLVERARQEHLIARALVRTTLSRYADVDPRSWSFSANEHGRPYLNGPPGAPRPRFNLSHTRGLVACAVTRQAEVGVDVEYTRRKTATVAIADRFFAEAKVAELNSLPAHRRRDRFFDYWTLKESYIKARGMGLAIPLGQFAFRMPGRPNAPITVDLDPELGDRADRWRFWQFSPSSDHRAALCVEQQPGVPLRLTTRTVVPLAQPA